MIAQKTRTGLCLLHTIRGECHVLNAVAAFVWNCLETHFQKTDEGMTSEILAKQVGVEYEVSHAAALSDVTVFIGEAMAAGVIICSDPERDNT